MLKFFKYSRFQSQMSKQCSTVIDSQDPLMILNILWKKFTSRTKPTVILLVFLFYLCFMYFEIGEKQIFIFCPA